MRTAISLLLAASLLPATLLVACSSDPTDSGFVDPNADAGGGSSSGDPTQQPGPNNGIPGGETGSSSGGGTGPRCGNAVLDTDESCDDGNDVAGDGCDGSCAIEAGYECPVLGAQCVAAACGDGVRAGIEDCDDGNSADGDGCSSTCRLEDGFKCAPAGGPCTPTVCGDGIKEGTEQCDDGNTRAFDGCSPSCTIEPSCAGGTCTAVCGDGLKFPNEACDDGNTRHGDGCSATCELEPGFECTVTVSDPPQTLELPIVYRDFLPSGYGGAIAAGYTTHPDFQTFSGCQRTGMVQAQLDQDGKPVFNPAPSGGRDCVASAASFAQWYRDDQRGSGDKLVSQRLDRTLTLNRQQSGAYVFSNSAFFPLDGLALGTEAGMRDGSGTERNFHFTSELRYYFTYHADASPTLDFTGDDDVWVFINGRLAVDLGGVHGALSASVQLTPAKAAELGLVDRGMYEIVLFQAERHTTQSNYRLTLNGFERARTSCSAVCGDGIKTATEACDHGAAENVGGYGKCNADCTLGPRCGDGVRQAEAGEECDDGNLVDGDGCSSSCKISGSNGPH